jgi:threonine dehydrogenase-like Zn-dependent dehydrogenase
VQSPEHVTDVLALTDGKGAHLIVEMLASANLGADLRMLARGGTVAVVGSRGPVEVRGDRHAASSALDTRYLIRRQHYDCPFGAVQIDPRELMQREAAIVGVMGPATAEEDAEALAFISAGTGRAAAASARIRPTPHAAGRSRCTPGPRDGWGSAAARPAEGLAHRHFGQGSQLRPCDRSWQGGIR